MNEQAAQFPTHRPENDVNILITGGTGFIGGALTTRLIKDGHSLTALVRSADRARKVLVPAVSMAPLSMLDNDLDELMSDADAVVNLAGGAILGKRWSARQKQVVRNGRVELTTRLTHSMLRCSAPPKVFLSASAVGYYGDAGDRELKSDSPAGDDFLAQLCVDWEAAAGLARPAGVRVVTPRIGVVLGRGGGAMKKMMTPFRMGLGGPIGSGTQYFPWIHIDDLVEMILQALSDNRYTGPFNAVGPEPVMFKTFARSLGRALGKPAILPVPAFALRLLLGEAAAMLLTGQRAVPDVAVANDFTFRFPDLAAALEDIINRPLAS
jgi:uncharacterized protein